MSAQNRFTFRDKVSLPGRQDEARLSLVLHFLDPITSSQGSPLPSPITAPGPTSLIPSSYLCFLLFGRQSSGINL